jgi:hypothetical protein
MKEDHIERGYKPGLARKGSKKEVLVFPEGWKPYVYRGKQPFDYDSVIRCGTPDGYDKHLEKGETPCFDCCEAWEEEQMKVRRQDLDED